MKEITLANSTITLVTQNQPQSVNHEFLVQKNIIPKDFLVNNKETFYTPFASKIEYTNGFGIVTQPDKILFQVSNISNIEEKKESYLDLLESISSGYLTFFKEMIKWNAAGINFQFIKDDLQFDTFVDQSIKPDSLWFNFKGKKGDIQKIDISYDLKGKQFNVTIHKALKRNTQNNNEEFCTLFTINVHYDRKYDDNIVNVISELKENYKNSQEFLGRG